MGIPYKRLYTISERCSVPIFGKIHGGNETWKFKLLNFIEYKKCTSCQEILPHNAFGVDKSTSDGLYSTCKNCRVSNNATSYLKPHIQEAHKRSQERHYDDILARNATYRAERKYRVPGWYDTQKDIINTFYANCPEGYHVDHVIPLKGKLAVSYTHLRAHETPEHLVCRLLLEKKKNS